MLGWDGENILEGNKEVACLEEDLEGRVLSVSRAWTPTRSCFSLLQKDSPHLVNEHIHHVTYLFFACLFIFGENTEVLFS